MKNLRRQKTGLKSFKPDSLTCINQAQAAGTPPRPAGPRAETRIGTQPSLVRQSESESRGVMS